MARDPRQAAARPPPPVPRGGQTDRVVRHRRGYRRVRGTDRIDYPTLPKGCSWLDTPCRWLIGVTKANPFLIGTRSAARTGQRPAGGVPSEARSRKVADCSDKTMLTMKDFGA